MGRFVTICLVILGVVAFFAAQSLYTVDVVNYAVLQQFGKINKVDATPGLKFKIPFIQKIDHSN